MTNSYLGQQRTIYVDLPSVTLTIDRPGTGTGALTATGLSSFARRGPLVIG